MAMDERRKSMRSSLALKAKFFGSNGCGRIALSQKQAEMGSVYSFTHVKRLKKVHSFISGYFYLLSTILSK